MHPAPANERLAARYEALIRLAERRAFGPSTAALIDEAMSRDSIYPDHV